MIRPDLLARAKKYVCLNKNPNRPTITISTYINNYNN